MATRQGKTDAHVDPARRLQLVRPDGLRLFIHPTPAGRLPVVVAEAREDFVTLVQALARHNEPEPIPASMGACILSGYSNWDRIARLRRDWEEQPSGERHPPTWEQRFREIVEDRQTYQDRFVILSAGPYSDVTATDLGRDPEQWASESLHIRLAHESTHYFTRKVMGRMRNVLTDELVADYIGIVAGTGRFRADWFLRFMGLDVGTGCRSAGRLQIYRGAPPLSEGAFFMLQMAVRRAAYNLEAFFELSGGVAPIDDAARAQTIITLTSMGLEGMAGGALLGRAGGLTETRTPTAHAETSAS